MNNDKVSWRGSFPAVVTPFKKDGALDEHLFTENLELLMDEGADGFVVCGSTGESWSLDGDEKVRLAELAVQVVGGKVPVIVGTGEIRTDRVVDVSIRVRDVGASGILVVTPYYAEVDQGAIVAHYRAVSDAVCCPIVLYNHPQTTGVNLDAGYIAQLAEIEWVVATKESANDISQMYQLLFQFGDMIEVIAGYTAKHGAAAAFMGCPAFIGATETQVLGAEGIGLFALGAAGDVDGARRVQKRASMLGPIGKIGATPAGLKAAMNLLGRPGGHCRSPIPDLSNAQREKVREVLDSLDLFSSPACRLT
ncbi:dihydrodipicolinate synthase family protein [Rhodospirillaceae bacterium SYSU D60014]|uniref:dihydrodipicolinate synthase family protein n=1 Tax=Virgifigura deserti TaxID=2268457 RepID=UPI0013C4B8B5